MTDITLKTREGNRLDLLHTLPKGGVCAELGVLAGDFSEKILQHCDPKRLYLVDMFRGQIQSGDQDGQNMAWYDMEHMANKLRERFLDKPVTVVQADDIGWLMTQPRGLLDWCYIDSDHSYEHALAAILAALDTVKVGGRVLGHDYHPKAFPGVCQAVHLVALRFGLDLTIWTGDRLPSFELVNNKRELRDYAEYGE